MYYFAMCCIRMRWASVRYALVSSGVLLRIFSGIASIATEAIPQQYWTSTPEAPELIRPHTKRGAKGGAYDK